MQSRVITADTQAQLASALLAAGLVQFVEAGQVTAPGVVLSWISAGSPASVMVALDETVITDTAAAWDALQTGGATLDTQMPAIRVLWGAEQPEVVPQRVTMRQARLALLGAGLLNQVTAAINALPEPQRTAANITWEYSQEVQRHNGLVPQMAAALGMTPEQIDQLFIAAGNL